MNRPRVMYVVTEYPAVSETYIKSELEAIRDEYDVLVLTTREAVIPYRNPLPFRRVGDPEAMLDSVREFRPHVLHGHWLNQAETLSFLSKSTGIPFTIRAHSFDTIPAGPARRQAHGGGIPDYMKSDAALINEGLCLGVLTFPFTVPTLEAAGVRPEKIFPCYPVVHFRRFHDRSPNGRAVMNVGACLPKKRMEDFLNLATLVPGLDFNLYPLGHRVGEVAALNEALGSPVNIVPPVEPDLMPGEYKKHRWLVYTACTRLATVGWPLSVAEAQASGVGVCLQNLRPDLREYVGEAGYLFDTLEEAAEIISKPFPEEKRQLGFEQARRSDIFTHKTILTDLWRKAHARPGRRTQDSRASL